MSLSVILVDMRFVVLLMLVALVAFVSLVGVRVRVDGWNVSVKERAWWLDTVAPVEGFQSGAAAAAKKEEEDEGVLSSALAPASLATGAAPASLATGAAPASLDRRHPYHLLGDVLPAETARASGVTSRSCWATDAEAQLSKVGSYRQLTNNWRREYPDSCSMGQQDMVLAFYEPRSL